jgi:hypothetical protein
MLFADDAALTAEITKNDHLADKRARRKARAGSIVVSSLCI